MDTKSPQVAPLALAPCSAVWLLFGGYDYEGDDIIACCASEAEARAIKAYGEENKNKRGDLRYGYHSLRVSSVEVGYREDGIPVLPNSKVSHAAQKSHE